MVTFPWTGQKLKVHSRVKLKNLTKKYLDGGVGLIALLGQVVCLSGKIILWTFSKGEHPLQSIMKKKIRDLSRKKWGVADSSWVFNPSRMVIQNKASARTLLGKHGAGMDRDKGIIQKRELCNTDDLGIQPLWTPSKIHHSEKIVCCSMQPE
jgi:hypothetical protein